MLSHYSIVPGAGIKCRILFEGYLLCKSVDKRSPESSGEAPSAANVGHLGKDGNEVHRPRMTRPSGGSGALAARVGPLGKVTYIAGESRLASTHARASELLRLIQQAAN